MEHFTYNAICRWLYFGGTHGSYFLVLMCCFTHSTSVCKIYIPSVLIESTHHPKTPLTVGLLNGTTPLRFNIVVYHTYGFWVFHCLKYNDACHTSMGGSPRPGSEGCKDFFYDSCIFRRMLQGLKYVSAKVSGEKKISQGSPYQESENDLIHVLGLLIWNKHWYLKYLNPTIHQLEYLTHMGNNSTGL